MPMIRHARRCEAVGSLTAVSVAGLKWDQDPGNGGAEPEHPAPSLTLTPKGAAPAPSGNATVPVAATSADDGTARLLGGLGLAAGVLGVGVGGFGLARSRRNA
ncbi:hypothetical protein ACFY4C_32100 [Actinomadura viridis]|uniref:hypothetical protein n=1 Tax=Actinomadura viridis TaxID=58110 RepID=UPI0036C865B5